MNGLIMEHKLGGGGRTCDVCSKYISGSVIHICDVFEQQSVGCKWRDKLYCQLTRQNKKEKSGELNIVELPCNNKNCYEYNPNYPTIFQRSKA